ncbi:MAG TPA: S-layer homology domain-containing protein [Pyrinomonadaceae bacterium]
MSKIHLRFPRHKLFTLAALGLALLCLAAPPRADLASAGRRPAVALAARSNVAVNPNPSVSGRWETDSAGNPDVYDWSNQNVPIHVSVLPDGRVLFWGRDKQDFLKQDGVLVTEDVRDRSMANVWSPHYGKDADGFIRVNNSRTNLFCSGHSFLQDGRLLVVGGQGGTTGVGNQRLFPNPPTGGNPCAAGTAPHPDDAHDKSIDSEGSAHINIFDYRDNSWAEGPTMSSGRWYPYNLTLSNGEVFIVSGTAMLRSPRCGDNLTTSPARVPVIFDLNGNLRHLSSTAQDSVQGSTNLYPKVHLGPDGHVFLGVALSFDKQSRVFNVATNTWQQLFGAPEQLKDGFKDLATSVLYEQGKVLLLGGRGDLTTAGQTIADAPLDGVKMMDLNASPRDWKSVQTSSNATAKMNFRRIYHTPTLLPDGKVLVTGGTQCPGTLSANCADSFVRHPELWDPATRSFAVMAPGSDTPRVYHSFAVLLPDARVLVGGGGRPFARDEVTNIAEDQGLPPHVVKAVHEGAHKSVEIFSPPYLFDPQGNPIQTRPSITSAPEKVVYNQQFTVGVGSFTGQDIAQAVLVRLPSVTHQFDPDQRRVVLDVVERTDRAIRLAAPRDGIRCPPGPYMLFLLTQNGSHLLPSKAKIVTVGNLALERPVALLGGSSQAFSPALGELNSPGGANLRKLVVRTTPLSQPPAAPTPTPAPGATPAPAPDWSATVGADTPWLRIESLEKNPATGFGVVNFTVDPNTAPGAVRRTGTIRVRLSGAGLVYQEFKVHQAMPFADVPESSPFHLVVSKLAARGITGGCGAGLFCGDSTITRAQLAVFLIEAMGALSRRPAGQPLTSNPFSDVPKDHWAAPQIKELVMRKITSGCGSNSFCPDAAVSRGSMAVLICTAMGVSPPPTDVPAGERFSDVAPDHNLAPFIYELKRRGVVTGFADGTYRPDQAVTRQEMAAFLTAAFNL